ENLDRLEAGVGILYILGTNTFTKEGDEIVKIGITTGSIERRIAQLFNTSTPYRFRVIQTIESPHYAELEQAIHRLLHSYRVSQSREFFRATCLPWIERIVDLHEEIVRSDAVVEQVN